MTVPWLRPTPPVPPAQAITLRIASADHAVTYQAPCPGCGREVWWNSRQQDTRAILTVGCTCPVVTP